MDALIELSWRMYPAVAIITAGALIALVGLRREVRAYRLPAKTDGKALAFVRGLRLALVGLAVAALGAAWAWHLPWLAILTLVILGEELLEASFVTFGLTRGRTLRLRP